MGRPMRADTGAPPRARGGRLQHHPGPRRPGSTPASAGRTRRRPSSQRSGPEHPRERGEDMARKRMISPDFGAPPRARGGRSALAHLGRCAGSTPASAGRTRPSQAPARCSSEHPRERGEDVGVSCSGTGSAGAPPRARGGPAIGHGRPSPTRSTPASAGRTTHPAPAPTCRAEHPRERGEDESAANLEWLCRGAPPRARGGRSGIRTARSTDGSTPASAGRTARGTRTGSSIREHPRERGEDRIRGRSDVAREGAPPRARGGRGRGPLRQGWLGSTPASAGRTRTSRLAQPGRAEHPRERGEDWMLVGVLIALVGAPPRARGGHAQASDVDKRRGAPPRARGGRRADQHPAPPAREHPRERGEDFTLDTATNLCYGSTPASAGRTATSRRTPPAKREHPRERGEDSRALPAHTVDSGEHPRERGEDWSGHRP